MNKIIFTIKIFGLYILLTGLLLLFVPSLLLAGLKIGQEPNIWMNLLGLALAALGVYYLKAAHDSNLDFIKGSIPVRIGQLFVVSALVYMYDGPYVLIAVSAIECCSGIWTWWHLRNMH